MDKKKDFRNVMLVALVFAILVMAVGYAALSQRLTVNANASISDAKWKVRLTDISFDSANSSVSSTASEQSLDPAEAVEAEGSTGAKFNVTLAAPGDKAVYTVTVSNLGTIDAELDAITDLTVVNENEPTDIVYTVTESSANAAVLGAGETHTYTITVEWKAAATDLPEVTEKQATIYFDYIQA